MPLHLPPLIAPLREAGLPLHPPFGNHDDRGIFRTSLKNAIPAVAYPFAATEVTGWLDAKLSEKGAALSLHAHGKIAELVWRAA